MRYRLHRGSLADAMSEVIEVADKQALVDHLNKDLAQWGVVLSVDDIKSEPYGYDPRIDWNTHVVLMRNQLVHEEHRWFGTMDMDFWGVLGFADQSIG